MFCYETLLLQVYKWLYMFLLYFTNNLPHKTTFVNVSFHLNRVVAKIYAKKTQFSLHPLANALI